MSGVWNKAGSAIIGSNLVPNVSRNIMRRLAPDTTPISGAVDRGQRS